MNVGAVVSMMVMVCVLVLAFPQASTSCQMRSNVPAAPQVAVKLSVMFVLIPEQSSAGIAGTPVPEVGLVQSRVRSAGGMNDGGVVSTRLMSWVCVFAFPQASVTDHTRVMVPAVPQVLVKLSAKLVLVPEQASDVPLGTPAFAGDVDAVQSSVMAAGTVKVGAVVSTMVMV